MTTQTKTAPRVGGHARANNKNSHGYSNILERLRKLPGVKGTETKFTCCCPAHEDRENSLSVAVCDKGKVLLFCHAGCKTQDVVAALGGTTADLSPPEDRPAPKSTKQEECTYPYRDASGQLLYEVVRYRPKDFRQRRPDGADGWIWSLKDVERVLYRLPEVLKAKAEGQTIYLCEGEKDADSLAKMGLCATTNAGGAAKWQQSFTDTLAGADVVILPDNDDPGMKAAQARHEALPGSVVLTLPGLSPKGDVSDWIAQGGTLEALQALVEEARNNPVGPVEEGEAKTIGGLPPFDDMSEAFDLADKPIPCLFREGVFMRGNVVLIVSEAGCGKSQIALGLGLSVGLFKSFVAGFTPDRPGRALMLFGEDAPHPTAQRIKSWCTSRNVTRADFEAACIEQRLKFICGQSASLINVEGGAIRPSHAYTELLESGREYDLIVLDTLAEWLPVSNENDNSMMHAVGKMLVDLARETGACVVVLHHTNKSADKSGTTGLHSVRGGSGLGGKVREAFQLCRLSDAEVNLFKIDSRDVWRYVRLHDVKGNYRPGTGAAMYFERGEGGVLEARKLIPPSTEDKLLELAEALALRLGDNPNQWTKWQVIREKQGADFRAELKMYNEFATVKNLGLAYDLAVNNGLIVEENGTHEAGGQCSILPRKADLDDAA